MASSKENSSPSTASPTKTTSKQTKVISEKAKVSTNQKKVQNTSLVHPGYLIVAVLSLAAALYLYSPNSAIIPRKTRSPIQCRLFFFSILFFFDLIHHLYPLFLVPQVF